MQGENMERMKVIEDWHAIDVELSCYDSLNPGDIQHKSNFSTGLIQFS